MRDDKRFFFDMFLGSVDGIDRLTGALCQYYNSLNFSQSFFRGNQAISYNVVLSRSGRFKSEKMHRMKLLTDDTGIGKIGKG